MNHIAKLNNKATKIWQPLVVFLCCFITSTAQASSWVLSEGDAISSSALTYYNAKSYWDQDSKLQDTGCTSNNAYLYQSMEYGYSYYRTVFMNTSFASQKCGRDNTSGLSDVQLGIRGRLDDERNGRAWELSVIIPTGYSSTEPQRIGYGRLGVEAGIFTSEQSRGFEDVQKTSYMKTGLRLRYWLGAPATQAIGSVAWVQRLARKHRLQLGVNGYFSLRDGRPETISLNNQVRLSDYDTVNFEARYRYRISNEWSTSFSIGQDVWGRNSGKGRTATWEFTRAWSL